MSDPIIHLFLIVIYSKVVPLKSSEQFAEEVAIQRGQATVKLTSK